MPIPFSSSWIAVMGWLIAWMDDRRMPSWSHSSVINFLQGWVIAWMESNFFSVKSLLDEFQYDLWFFGVKHAVSRSEVWVRLKQPSISWKQTPFSSEKSSSRPILGNSKKGCNEGNTSQIKSSTVSWEGERKHRKVSHPTWLRGLNPMLASFSLGGEGKNRLAYIPSNPQLAYQVPVHPPHRWHEGRSLQLLVPWPSSHQSSKGSGHRMFLWSKCQPCLSQKGNNDRNINDYHVYYHWSLLLLSIYKHLYKF